MKKPIHDQMARLYLAAKVLKNVVRPTEIADLLGTSPQVIKHWEKRGVSKDGMVQAESALGCRAAWIRDGRGEMCSNSDTLNFDKEHQVVMVPLVSWTMVGMVDKTSKELETIPIAGKARARSFALRVRDDSMEPEFVEGDLIIVDPDREPSNGSFVVLRSDDNVSATFKQLVIDGGQRFLKPLNERYPIAEMSRSQRILGVVTFKSKAYP